MTNTNSEDFDGSAYSSRWNLEGDRAEILEFDASTDGIVIPVVEEQLEVGTRKVETGRVRITKTVHSHEEIIDEPILQERVEVERVAVGRPVSEAPGIRCEGDTVIVPVMEEIVVVTTQLILKEELRITKIQTERRDPLTVSLRSEEVDVERISVDTSAQAT